MKTKKVANTFVNNEYKNISKTIPK